MLLGSISVTQLFISEPAHLHPKLKLGTKVETVSCFFYVIDTLLLLKEIRALIRTENRGLMLMT